MKNSFGLPWHGSVFSSFFFSVFGEDVDPRRGTLSDMPRACFLALGIKAVLQVLTKVVGATYDVPKGAG
jgi:hypothetical protein